jgi:TldD protein
MNEEAIYNLLENSKRMGAEYSEVRYHEVLNTSIVINNSMLLAAATARSKGYATRIYKKGSLAFTSVDSEEKLGEAFTSTLALTNVRGFEEGMSKEEVNIDSYVIPEKKKIMDTPIDVKIKYLIDLSKELLSLKTRNRIVNIYLAYNDSIEEKKFYSSEGSKIHSKIPRVSIFYNLVLSNGSQVIHKDGMLGNSGGLELLDEWNLHENLGNEIKILDKILSEAKETPKGEMDVVVSGEISGIIAHESIGHPFEADRILGRETAQAGRSYLSPSDLGKRIGSEVVNVIDDPTINGSFGYYLYDDEGIKARPRYLIKNGAVNEFLHNRFTARRFSISSNGSSRTMDFESEPIIRMANTYFAPGDHSIDELIEGIKFGVYIKSYMEWNIDDIRWGQRYGGLESYLIENGKIKDLVKFPVLEGTTGEILSSIDAVGKDLKFSPGLCGKGEPMQGVPVWFGGPHIRIRKVRVKKIGE